MKETRFRFMVNSLFLL